MLSVLQQLLWKIRTRFCEFRLVLFCGLSGAGKSTLVQTLNHQVTVIELDHLLVSAYSHLNLKQPDGDPFSYQAWRQFLESKVGQTQCVAIFRTLFRERVPVFGPRNIVIVGNHFVVPSILNMIETALVDLGLRDSDRIALDIPEEDILARRRSRANSFDRQVTLSAIKEEVTRLRKTMPNHGFVLLNSEDCRTYFEALISAP